MIKVLHVFGGLNCGGAETMIMNYYRKIDKNKIQFGFVVHGNEIGEYEKEIVELGGAIYRVPKYKIYNHIDYLKAWNHIYINYKEYSIVHCHIRSTASIILRIAKKYNLITISHSHSTSNGHGFKSIVKKILQKKIPKFADFLFACSKESAKWLFGKYCLSNRCFILNNSINVEEYIYNDVIRKKVRNELNLRDELSIIQIGRLCSVKNHILSLKIISKLDNVKLFIVGNGSLKHKLEKRIKSMNLDDKVVFMGTRRDIPDLLQAMDVFIMPSLYEGLPLSLIEAQASSLPCVISNKIESGVFNELLVKKLPLTCTIETWCETILSLREIERVDSSNLIVANNFDVTNSSKWLENFYITNYNDMS